MKRTILVLTLTLLLSNATVSASLNPQSVANVGGSQPYVNLQPFTTVLVALLY